MSDLHSLYINLSNINMYTLEIKHLKRLQYTSTNALMYFSWYQEPYFILEITLITYIARHNYINTQMYKNAPLTVKNGMNID